MKKLYFIGIILFLSPLVRAQDCLFVLSGKIVDEKGLALPGATAQIKKLNLGEATNEAGIFRFEKLCKGIYLLSIQYLGYEGVEKRITIDHNLDITIELQPAEQILQEVVVAGHTEVATRSNNTTTLSARELDEVNGKSLGETLQNLSGVNSIQSGPAIFKPVIHGVHSQRILILNNGIRQEGQQWGAEHAPEIDPFIANNLTVIKDAGAIKYGTDALGGVIVVTPAELPTDQQIGGELHLIGNSNGKAGTLSGLLEGGIKNAKGWGWRVQGTGRRSGDSRTPDYLLSNTGFREMNYSASAGHHSETSGFEVFYSHFNTTIGILRGSASESTQDLAMALHRNTPAYTTNFSYTINEPRQEVMHNLVKVNGHIRSNKNLYNLQYGLQINTRKEFDVRRGTTLTEKPALAYKLFTHTLDAERETTLSEDHSRCIGINSMVQDNNKIDGTQTLPFIPNFRNYSAGVFWIEKISGNKADYDLGLRYDYRLYQVAGFNFQNKLYKTQFGFGNVTATAGASVKLSKTTTFITNVGSAWRPPNVAELYSLGTHQSAAAIEYGLLLDEITTQVKEIENSGVKPEHALKWVNTFKFQKGRWQAEATGYINYIFNYVYLKPRGITEAGRGPFAYFRYTQTNASFTGIDASTQYELSQRFSLHASASLLRAKDVTQNDFLIFIPTNRYDLSLRYESNVNKKTFFAQAKLKYVAQQNRAPRVVGPEEILAAKEQGIDLFATDKRNFDFIAAPQGYALLSVTTGLSLPVSNTKLDFRLTADNLTNTRYREYTNRMRYFANEIGRNISVAVNLSF
ncbi:MAG TPA: TonB-dependent receptor [Cyclobacteriaceae bacterium]|nr:TonB-dependent receptor [Cytophagales bacterium]HRE65419.1 TonB-dependent receptor [Cyclobacteriaceae bacterium]HRF34254.1 TonB-dependent receptor [Cyclobacteriaceae bacterium]